MVMRMYNQHNKNDTMPEQSLRIVKEPRIEETITVLMNNSMYFIDFAFESSQFYRYLSIVTKIVS